MKRKLSTAGRFILVIAVGMGLLNFATPVGASGGSGSGGGGSTSVGDTIKVTKCEYAVVSGGYVELLVHAGSSNASAHLYAYLPNGTYLGEVQNGSGGRYGGTVFLSAQVPNSLTIRSSAGGSIIAPCVPFQP